MSEIDRSAALKRVFARIPAAELARALKLSRAAVYAWTQVPLNRVARIEDLTGIPREELRPDVFVRRRSRVRATTVRSGLRVA